VNRADGNSEIEGKAAKGSGERIGKEASFKSVVQKSRQTTDEPPSLARQAWTTPRIHGSKRILRKS
jgi:hypothetical protein